MIGIQSVIIHQISENEAMQRSFYRILHSERVSHEEIKEYIYEDCLREIEPGKHYLVIEDTTQPNFERNRRNISNTEGLGVIGDDKSLGFFLHPSLVVDAESNRCLGFSHIEHWSREAGREKTTQTARCKQPIEEKESYRWLHSALESCRRIDTSDRLTIICDREGDILEMFDRLRNCKLLIRSKNDRVVEGGKLYEKLSSSVLAGEYYFKVKGDKRSGRVSRNARMEVRYTKLRLGSSLDSKRLSDEVWAVEAREIDAPLGQTPIHWRILTTHSVESFDQACQIIAWYGMRWHIEQVFRLMKQKGLSIEESDMESGKSLIMLTLLGLLTIVKVMTLHTCSKQETPEPIKETFSSDEIKCMRGLCTRYEGRTQRQKNPYSPDSLQWCYWVIARLGGWKPQEKQAGVIVLQRGWYDFQRIFYGYSIAICFVS